MAGLLVTTEAMVAELPKKEHAHPAMPGGGMGGWTTDAMVLRAFPSNFFFSLLLARV